MPTGVYKHKPSSEETKRKIGLANSRKVEVICVICAKKRLLSPAFARVQKCCSNFCRYKYVSLNYSGVNSKAGYRNASFLKKCLVCNGEFITTKVRIKDGRGKFCSRKCQSKSLESRGGSQIASWMGGKTPEHIRFKGLAWWNELRKKVYKRDNYICQECGIKCTRYNRADKIQCDHIIPRSMGGSHDISNLWTLCNKCHGKKDGKMRVIFKQSGIIQVPNFI